MRENSSKEALCQSHHRVIASQNSPASSDSEYELTFAAIRFYILHSNTPTQHLYHSVSSIKRTNKPVSFNRPPDAIGKEGNNTAAFFSALYQFIAIELASSGGSHSCNYLSNSTGLHCYPEASKGTAIFLLQYILILIGSVVNFIESSRHTFDQKSLPNQKENTIHQRLGKILRHNRS